MTKAKSSRGGAGPPASRAVVLPDDACPACGATMTERRRTLQLPINGEEVSVPEAAHLSCPECNEVVLRRDHARSLRTSALSRYRTKHDLLSGEEIRAIRERYGLTQTQLASLLRLGGNTLSRWESDRNVQTAALDVLLRLIRDVPASLEYLSRRAA